MKIFYIELTIKTMGSNIVRKADKVLGRYHTPVEIKDEDFKVVCEVVHELIKYSQLLQRSPIENIIEIGRKLRTIGAPVEAYKLLKNEAIYFMDKNEEQQYYHKMYFAVAFAALGYPTEDVEKELRECVSQLRGNRKFLPFLPLFLNILGNVLHIYRRKYREANELYEEAIRIIEKIEKEKFEEITIDRKYPWAYKLIVNNYIDSLFHVENLLPEEEEKLKYLFNLLDKIQGETKYAIILSELNKAEYLAHKGDRRCCDLLRVLAMDEDPDVKRIIAPSVRRIKAIYYAKIGQFQKSMVLILDSLKTSYYYGNTLEETQLLENSVDIFKTALSGFSKAERRKVLMDTSILKYLLKMQSAKDLYLGKEHSSNVSKLSKKLGEVLSLSQEELEILEFSGLVHDIGKLFIPWFTLNKLTPLDEIDKGIIKIHPVEGWRALNILGLEREAVIVRNHHERIDGSGYPDGRRELTLLDEIVGISDLFDAAVTPSRRYKEKKSPEEVIRELKESNPGKFSGRVIDALSRVIENDVDWRK